jgi:hypothetical protein
MATRSKLSFSILYIRPDTFVRVLLTRAFIDSSITGDYARAVAFYDHALRVLRWARQEYSQAPEEKKGPALRHPFVNGLRSLRLVAYQRVRVICEELG